MFLCHNERTNLIRLRAKVHRVSPEKKEMPLFNTRNLTHAISDAEYEKNFMHMSRINSGWQRLSCGLDFYPVSYVLN